MPTRNRSRAGRRGPPALTLRRAALLGLVLLVPLALWFATSGPGRTEAVRAGPHVTEASLAGAEEEAADEQGAARGPDETSSGGPAPLDLQVPRPAIVRVVRWPDERPLPGAEVSLYTLGGERRHRERTARDGLLPTRLGVAALPVLARVDAAGMRPFEQAVLELPPEGEALQFELVPEDGWFGRVVSPFGDPVPAAVVSAHQHWTPRPAWLQEDDGALALLATQGSAPAVVPAPTDEEGFFYVEPVPQENVVDLVLAVVGMHLASAPLSVPLPRAEQRLPDLVATPCTPLAGRVADVDGLPIEGARVHVDRTPGRGRDPEDVLESGPDGRFAGPRHLGEQHLLVQHDRHAFVQAWAAVSLATDAQGWVTVLPEDGELAIVMQAFGHLRGVVRDAATSLPVPDAVVVPELLEDDGGYGRREEGRTGADGAFHLLVPPEDVHRPAAVRVRASGYERLRTVLAIERFDDAPPVEMFAVPEPGSQQVTGHLVGWPLAEDTVELSAFLLPETSLSLYGVGAWLRADAPWLGEAERVWSGPAGPGGRFSFRVGPSPGRELVVVAELAQPGRPLRTAVWGPRRVGEAALLGVLLAPPPTQEVEVHVEGLLPGRVHLLQETSLNALTGRTWASRVLLEGAADHEGRARTSLAIGSDTASWLELRLQRGPVSAPLDGSDGRSLAFLMRQRRLSVPRFHVVAGEVGGWTPRDVPDTCVGLLGAAVPGWRSEALGEADWFVRPDALGRFRMEVPAGVYTLVLFRRADPDGVTVFSQRTITVDRALLGVDVRADGTPLDVPLHAGA